MTRPIVTSFLYSINVEFPEDLIIQHLRADGYMVGVGDGVDGFHSPKTPRNLINGESRAQVQRLNLLRCFLEVHPTTTLEKTLHHCIEALAAGATSMGISLDRPDELPGIDLAVAQINETTIDLFQLGGDAIAFWKTVAGDVGVTPCQGQEFERRKGREFRMYQGEYGTGEAWNRIEPTFRQARMDLTNTDAPGAYGTMNGQASVANCWLHLTFARQDISLLLLATDGLCDFHGVNEGVLARKMIELYSQGGWQAIFQAKGEINSGEGTGLAVEFR